MKEIQFMIEDYCSLGVDIGVELDGGWIYPCRFKST
jgi:hypothetical protein